MAEDGKESVDVFTVISEENHFPINSNVNLSPKPNSPDLNDSRISNPDDVQSPASNTYAVCEEIDSPSVAKEPISTMHADCEDIDSPSVAKEDVILEIIKVKELADESTTDVAINIINVNGVDSQDESLNDCKSSQSAAGDDFDTKEDDILQSLKVDQNSLKKEVENDRGFEDSVVELDDSDDGVSEVEDGEADAQSHSDYDEADNDRENGDGQEMVQEDEEPQKKLDDDEDRRNPQYIPKRGFFYEHDDRTTGTGSEKEESSAPNEPAALEPDPKKKSKRAIPDGRWQHDLYREDEQKTKSAQDLIDIYGYNIRNEESAPKARRRRKYGRGPNRYTRKWDDEDAYWKQTGKLRLRREKPPPVQRGEEYEAEFPVIDGKSASSARSRERRGNPPIARSQNHVTTKNDSEPKYRDDRRRTPPERKFGNEYTAGRPSRNLSKRVPGSNGSEEEFADHGDPRSNSKPLRTKFVINCSNVRGRGRAGKPSSHFSNSYDSEVRLVSEARNFPGAGRGRFRGLDRPGQQYFGGKAVTNDDVRDLTEQMANADLKPKRNILAKGDSERKMTIELQDQTTVTSLTSRSKRYSHQRQRLLPESNNDNNVIAASNVLSTVANTQIMTHMASMLETNEDPSALRQSCTTSRSNAPLMTGNQMTAAPPRQTVTASLPAVNSSSMPPNSMTVSASLIPLNAPQMTASGAALQAAAPPLPIMGFFQHPPGFSNQGTPSQLYAREQNVMGAPSNQPVQLVAFLPASPMMSNNSHTQAAPPPPPPPPPPIYPTSVISYPQAAPSQQTQASFNSETYTMPPVTLAPLHQPPDVYQSRGGVTYYNTRSQVNPRSPPPPRVKAAIPIVPPPGEV